MICWLFVSSDSQDGTKSHDAFSLKLLHPSRCRQKLNPMIHPITRITDVNTLYDYLEEARLERGEGLQKSEKFWHFTVSCDAEQIWIYVNGCDFTWTVMVFAFEFPARFWQFCQYCFNDCAILIHIVAVFLCFSLPGVYSSDLQEFHWHSISREHLSAGSSELSEWWFESREAKDGHGWPICMMQQTDVQPHKASLANMLV